MTKRWDRATVVGCGLVGASFALALKEAGACGRVAGWDKDPAVLDEVLRLGADGAAVEHFRVPGSFEIPLVAQRLAQSGRFDAVVCLGTVIRGETPHFEYVAGEVTKGIAQAALKTGVPVLYGVVTADTLEQAIDRAGVKAGNKGFEAAMSAVEMVNLLSVISDK